MKINNILITLIFFVLSSCAGITTDTINGFIKIQNGSMSIKNGDDYNRISEGELSIDFDYGTYGIYLPSVTIEQYGLEVAVISIPRESLGENKEINISAADVGQKFDIKGEVIAVLLDRWTENRKSVSCTYSGYCFSYDYMDGDGDGDGDYNYNYNYGYHHDCSGTRLEDRRYSKYVDKLELNFFRASSDHLLATFTGEEMESYVRRKVLDWGTCN